MVILVAFYIISPKLLKYILRGHDVYTNFIICKL